MTHLEPGNDPLIARRAKAAACAPAVRMPVTEDSPVIVSCRMTDDVLALVGNMDSFALAESRCPDFSPGKRGGALFVTERQAVDDQLAAIEKSIAHYKIAHGRCPAVVGVQNVGLYSVSETKHGADTVLDDLLAAVSTRKPTSPTISQPSKPGEAAAGRVAGKIVVVTGSAQGFGKGIAEELAQEGAFVVIADINETPARRCAAELCERFGRGRAIPIVTDVSREESIENLMTGTILSYGGIDAFISNAGILKAGSLEETDLKTFELVTKINYTAYFLCVKHASRYMKIQHRFNSGYFSDIIQINSKSGLEGSNKNFAYAGGKFGSIGLTQSFALELVDFNIKVNAISPGNFFEGPLWADPVNGLFAQYLRANKVAGAKTIDDVKRFYENKVPMKRGCSVRDVALAVFYILEQNYETGQAVPVTGGQVMLR